MNDCYFIYYNPLKLFLRTHEGRFEHTMKEATEVADEYSKDKDRCPSGCVADVLMLINAKDVMFNLMVPWEEKETDSNAET